MVNAGAGHGCRVGSAALGSQAELPALPHVSLWDVEPLSHEQLVLQAREMRLSLPSCC